MQKAVEIDSFFCITDITHLLLQSLNIVDNQIGAFFQCNPARVNRRCIIGWVPHILPV